MINESTVKNELIFLDDNASNMQNYPISIGLFFIKDFIFLVKKNFFDQILKVSFKEKFWSPPK